jgi:integrase
MESDSELLSPNVVDTFVKATPEKRKRGKSMSRRSGQSGHIAVRGKYYVVRFWIDVPGQEKRRHASVRVCPISGLGRLTKPERERRAVEIISASGADTPECLAKAEGASNGVTFREQAAWWIKHVQQRRRKPIAPATVESWQGALNVWILPNLGDVPLGSVGNLALKGLVGKMVKLGLSPKTVNTYSQVVKSVVASAVNEEGEQLFPRKWNHEFVDMPVVEKSKQNTPHFTSEVIAGILASSKGYKQMFCALLAGSGLRVGEASGLEIDKHVSEDFKTLHIRQKVRRGKLELFLKTDAGCRDVDLCNALAGRLKSFVGSRTSGFLFRNRNGNPLSQTNLLRRGLHPALIELGQPKAGFHAFRRYRATWLRKTRTPEDLIRFWLGHADETVTDGYSKLREDVQYRKEVTEQVGLGFEFSAGSSDVVPNVPSFQLTEATVNAM